MAAPSAIRCIGCGYDLAGLSRESLGVCPECGRPPLALHCLRCGYELSGTATPATCPECALPVSHSAIDWATGPGCAYLGRVRGGTRLMSLALLVLWLEGLSFAIPGIASLVWGWTILAGAAWLWSAGCLRLAAPGPLGMVHVDRATRQVLRVAAPALFWSMAGSSALVLLSMLNFFDSMSEPWSAAMVAVGAVSGLSFLISGLISWAEGFGAVGGLAATVLRERGLRKRCVWMAAAPVWATLGGAVLMVISPVLIAFPAVAVNLLGLWVLAGARAKIGELR
jgi:hypothetical protein